ncbi:MAG: SEC-C domain-containing protein [Acidobacteria bacterium]|nr:SEC-C domain-containing protein [Acidobacteriota bacterium]
MKVGRNEPCPCGSGKKHKSCCQKKGTRTEREWAVLWVVLGVLLAVGAVAALHQQSKQDKQPAPQRVWSEEHGHWHTVRPNQPAPQPPGPPPPGKVWSEEHGHWHDSPPTPTDTALPE